jgi:hypothetical protein
LFWLKNPNVYTGYKQQQGGMLENNFTQIPMGYERGAKDGGGSFFPSFGVV